MTSQLSRETLAALVALGAIGGSDDEFVREFGNIILTQINNADVRRALQFVLERDGGDQFIARVVKTCGALPAAARRICALRSMN